MQQGESLGSMADGGPDERQSIGSINRALKRYGSTSNHDKRSPETLLRTVQHEVESGDTLQGLALKYGTTMEQIRRANRLWTGDSLFVRDTLLIPVAADSASACTSSGLSTFSSADSGNSSDSSSPEERPSAILQEARAPSTRTAEDPSESSPSEFLCKIDSAIAHTKSQVSKFNSKTQFYFEEEVESGSRSRRRPCVSRLRPRTSSETDPRLMSSLQKLEQSQDAIFEL